MVSLLLGRKAEGRYEPAVIPVRGRMVTISLSLVSITVIVVFLCRRLANLSAWKNFPLTRWLIIAIYTDSFLFVFATALVSQGLGLNNSNAVCASAVISCLVFYMTTKMIYLFLVERVRIVRGRRKPRWKDHLYVFNFFGMLVPYLAVIVLNLKFRFAHIKDGICIIGIQLIALIPLVGWDVVANVYLTLLFLFPLWNAYSFKNKTNVNLRKVALRAFTGGCVTLVSSIVNLLTIMILKGEPGWICLICCNSDILFSCLVLQWVTNGDGPTVKASYANEEAATPPNRGSDTPCKGQELANFGRRLNRPENDIFTPQHSRQTIITSQSTAEESGMKKDSVSGSDDLESGKNEMIHVPAIIMKTISVTVESTREGSLAEEGETQTKETLG